MNSVASVHSDYWAGISRLLDTLDILWREGSYFHHPELWLQHLPKQKKLTKKMQHKLLWSSRLNQPAQSSTLWLTSSKFRKSENQIWNQGLNSRWRPDRIGRDLWRGPCTLPFIGSTCGGEWHKLRHHQLKFWLQKKAIENLNRESVTIDMAIGTAMFYEEKKYFSKPCFHSVQISRNEKELKQSDWEEI